MPQRVINMGSIFPFSKVSVCCISRPPNYASKIWGQILGLYTKIYGIVIITILLRVYTIPKNCGFIFVYVQILLFTSIGRTTYR